MAYDLEGEGGGGLNKSRIYAAKSFRSKTIKKKISQA
jgi:hypothetical protein